MQWLFPIPKTGRFNGFAPMLCAADRDAFAADEALRANLRHSLDMILALYDYPAESRIHIRTTNPIESTFAMVRLRSQRSQHSGSRVPRLPSLG